MLASSIESRNYTQFTIKYPSNTHQMTPQKHASHLASELGFDFTRTLLEHMDDSSYIYSSPDCFILAVDAIREFGDDCHQEAIFVTLAVGNVQEFLDIDPRKETRQWLGFCREEGGEIHWIDYQRLRRMTAKRSDSQI